MPVRGIRGATTVESDSADQILEVTRELLQQILQANQIEEYDEIVSVIFTTTSDLVSSFPAEAAREVGMNLVPLLCASEIPVPGSLPKCIRVLMQVNTEKKQSDIVHIYLHEAKKLRPDVAGDAPTSKSV